jgi:hypothetical protein
MLVLETQTNNATAISFYLNFGFEFIGFDSAAYSNEDIEKKEVRLELGLRLWSEKSTRAVFSKCTRSLVVAV